MGLADYLSQTFQQQGTQAGQNAGQQMNMYNPAQQGLQGSLGGFYNQLLQGNIPQQFTNPQAPLQAFSANFDNQVMPGLAAQYGPGSSFANSAKAQGLQQLQGQLYNTGVGNFMNALGGAGNYAFNPIGGTTSGTQAGQNAMAGQTVNTINPLLIMLLNAIGGGAQALGSMF